MSFDLMQTCSGTTPSFTTITMTSSSSMVASRNLNYRTNGGFTFENKLMHYNLVSLTLSNFAVVSTCTPQNNPITIATSNTAAVTHFINNGSYSFNVTSSFSGDENCDDYFRTSTTSLHPTTPQALTYDGSNIASGL